MGIGPSKEEQKRLESINEEVEKLKNGIKLNGTLEDKSPAEVKRQGSVKGKEQEEESMEKLLKDFNEASNDKKLEAIKPIIEKTFLELNNHSDILAKYYQNIKIDNTAMEPTGRREFKSPSSKKLKRQKHINLEPVLKQLKQLKQLVEQICYDENKIEEIKKLFVISQQLIFIKKLPIISCRVRGIIYDKENELENIISRLKNHYQTLISKSDKSGMSGKSGKSDKSGKSGGGKKLTRKSFKLKGGMNESKKYKRGNKRFNKRVSKKRFI